MKALLHTCLAGVLVFSLSGCGSSDGLGLSGQDQEQTQTYAETFAPAKEALKAGRFEELVGRMNASFTKDGERMPLEDIKDELVSKNSELAIVERGLLTLNSGDFELALAFFDAAEQKLDKTESNGFSSFFGSMGGGGLAALTGLEESRPYRMRGYEKVMLYNYKALCYMLLGDRKAYNVTRNAIDRQQQEWEKFKERLAKLEAKQQEDGEVANISRQINADNRSVATKKKAALVSSAYVNPFGDYMNAVLQEIDSLDDKSLRDNARISYEKVVENNKSCSTARTASKAVMKNAPQGRKLVHVILSDGFAPERKEMSKALKIEGLTGIVNWTEAAPVPTKVTGARVRAAGQTANLTSLSRMESIALRDDQDMIPWRYTMMALALARSGSAGFLAQKLGLKSELGAGLVSKMQRPDTRAWLSLPNQVLVARMYVPNGTKQITVETLSGGSRLARANVQIAAEGPTVVYAVSYDNQLRAYANKNSWVKQ